MYGFIPRSCSNVLANGYGDCKELSILFCAFLESRGIRAYPALVSARTYFPQLHERYPNLGMFNHMIVAVDVGGKFGYFDPTITTANAGNSYYRVLGRKTLVLRPNASVIDSVVAGPHFSNAITTRSTLVAKPDGRWYIEGAISHYGLAAMDLDEELRTRTSRSEQTLLSTYLSEMFGILPLSAAVSSRCSDSVCITFTGDFSANVIRSPYPGFILKTPQLCRPVAIEAGDVTEGPWEIPAFTQTDIWNIPDDLTGSMFHPLSGSFAAGSWSRSGTAVARSFSMRHGILSSVKTADFTAFIRERSRFAQGTVWK
jgi:hypothetical protein